MYGTAVITSAILRSKSTQGHSVFLERAVGVGQETPFHFLTIMQEDAPHRYEQTGYSTQVFVAQLESTLWSTAQYYTVQPICRYNRDHYNGVQVHSSIFASLEGRHDDSAGYWKPCQQDSVCNITYFHGGDYGDCRLLVCHAVWLL
jgi:hypothetical protein